MCSACAIFSWDQKIIRTPTHNRVGRINKSGQKSGFYNSTLRDWSFYQVFAQVPETHVTHVRDREHHGVVGQHVRALLPPHVEDEQHEHEHERRREHGHGDELQPRDAHGVLPHHRPLDHQDRRRRERGQLEPADLGGLRGLERPIWSRNDHEVGARKRGPPRGRRRV